MEEYLINKYSSVVKTKAKSYFLIGADKEDIYQEGMIGLYKAYLTYEKNKNTQFSTYAYMLISRRMQSAIKSATNKNNLVL